MEMKDKERTSSERFRKGLCQRNFKTGSRKLYQYALPDKFLVFFFGKDLSSGNARGVRHGNLSNQLFATLLDQLEAINCIRVKNNQEPHRIFLVNEHLSSQKCPRCHGQTYFPRDETGFPFPRKRAKKCYRYVDILSFFS
jgi:hypothetical protein